MKASKEKAGILCASKKRQLKWAVFFIILITAFALGVFMVYNNMVNQLRYSFGAFTL